MTLSYNENVLIMPKKEKLHKKIVSCIDFDKQTYQDKIKKYVDKSIIPVLEKTLKKKELTYLRMQLISLRGENQFFNCDSYYYCNEKQSYSCFYFLSSMKFHVIPPLEKKISALKAYKTKQTYNCDAGTLLCIPSNSHYYFDDIEGHVLQLYDVISKNNLESYVQKLKSVEVNKNSIVQHFTQRLGLCYKKKLHFMYHWVHFFQYSSIKNDFQYKLCLTDLPPDKKSGHIITYENRPRILENTIHQDFPFDQFIIMEENELMVPDYYYLFKFIRVMILIMTISLCVVFWKDGEIRSFLGDKYKAIPVSHGSTSHGSTSHGSTSYGSTSYGPPPSPVASYESIPELIPLIDTC